MLIAQGPLSSHHLHGQLDSEFNLLEGFVFHAHIKFKHPVRFNNVCVRQRQRKIVGVVIVNILCLCFGCIIYMLVSPAIMFA